VQINPNCKRKNWESFWEVKELSRLRSN